VGKSNVKLIDNVYEWGVYLWQLPNGHLFHDGSGSFLSIQAYKDDLEAIGKLRKAAAYHGQPDGKPWWQSGGRQVSESEYSEQVDRLKEGYIPSMNDLGAVLDAKRGLEANGSE